MASLFVRTQKRPYKHEPLIPVDDLYSTIENQEREIASLQMQLKALKELYFESVQRERQERMDAVAEVEALSHQINLIKEKYEALVSSAERKTNRLQGRILFQDEACEADV